MPQEETPPGTDTPPTGIGAAVSDIVGLYAALSVSGHGARRTRLLAELARAGRRLAGLALVCSDGEKAARRSSRWQRRRVLAARGAAWIISSTNRARPHPEEESAGE
ncbi:MULTISPECIES: hypothetical protein [Streptomyces]|uniref:Uncharacterized protein n=1 Tax=Streptomyces morookaense TaxID=1970 RepID=A0A7Y7EAL6_STRMO|nr:MULTISPECIES: hypothetical protein [Streptomyces]MCC2274214.1 hypothetical protein [Streptomyces sp. ET3-23]NVK81617.1 hypothetical protein [Streptomyces morookaense]GHF09052.1 hypothetical protein GCM10010359_08020 [Streptomyces morookaense]